MEEPEELRCGRCGLPYRKRGFQVVVLPGLQAFDRLECATSAQRSGYSRPYSSYRDLASLEGLAAELFMTRVALEKERRAHLELQEAHLRLSERAGVLEPPAAVTGAARAAASGGGS